MNGNSINLNGNTLNLGDGTYAALLARNYITNGTLAVGTAEALIYVAYGQYATLGAKITGGSALTKFGSGTLTQQWDTASYQGPIYLNDGALVLTHAVDGVFSNNIFGTGNLINDGPSRMTLLGSNVIGGGVTLNTGSGLVLSNGATLYAAAGLKTIGNATSNVTVVVTGSNTVWDNGINVIYVGYNSAASVNNSLTVSAGATVTNVQQFWAGQSGGGNSVTITGGALVSVLNSGNGSGIYCGNGAGCFSNTLTVASGATLQGAGGNFAFNVGASSATGNLCTVNGGRVIIGATGYRNGVGGGYTPTGISVGNALIITNGGYLSTPYGFCIGGMSGAGSAGISNLVVVTGTNSLWVINSSLDLGSAGGVGGSTAVGNGLLIDAGATVTNAGNLSVGMSAGAVGNWLTITNGGRHFLTAGSAYVGNAADSNTMTVAGGPLGAGFWNLGGRAVYVGSGAANGNVLMVSGGLVTNITTLTVGTTNTSLNNSVTIANGGMLYATTVLNGGNTGGFVAPNSMVTVTSGGLLDASTLTNGPAAGNIITNNGGIYQFPTLTPVIAPVTFGTIALNNGVISFRNLSGVNVTNNVNGSALTNISFTGANAFRLNNSTNSAVAAQPQSYVFNTTGNPTNYAGLEMANGGTAYTNGSVTIGSPTSTNGWLTFSNTTAIIWGAVTNYGRLSIFDSTVTFKTNLVLGEGCSLIVTSNTVGNTVNVNGTLTLPLNATLTFGNSLATNASYALFQSTNAIVGTPANWVMNQPAYRLTVSTDRKQLIVRPKLVGFMFMVE